MLTPTPTRREASRDARLLARALVALRQRRERKAARQALRRIVADYPVRSATR